MRRSLLWVFATLAIALTAEGITVEAVEDERPDADAPRLDSVTEMPEVLVIGERLDDENPSTQTLSGDEMRQLPGAAGDAIRSLSALPSVSDGGSLGGFLVIRGSAQDITAYYNGMPLGYPFHFGGITSTLHPESIGQVEVLAGGYDARYGDAQAIINVESRRDGRREVS
ncbi:MAG: Plug domain-containing protein, partial [Candidatus Poribacteria bacterium]|nr:Plug domain-containing protein [Candidatus Poribacteria bacterium]